MSFPVQQHIKTLRKLSLALIISVCLNIFFVGYFSYTSMESDRIRLPFAEKPLKRSSRTITVKNDDLYKELSKLTNEELGKKLKDASLVEDGLKMRDIALGILIKERALDIEKALGGKIRYRQAQIGSLSLPIFTPLTDKQFILLSEFSDKEKWPITPHRMYSILKEQGTSDKSLEEAFLLTLPFQYIGKLFPKTEKSKLLNMVLEGNWNTLIDLPSSSLTDARQAILLKYIDAGSPTAAQLLLETEPYFAFKRLDDDQSVKVLKLLTDRNALTAKFVLSMLASPRNEEVKALAMQRLSSFTEQSALVSSLIPKKTEDAKLSTSLPPFKETKQYTVQPGDNLWKIAKKWKISLASLKKANNFNDDAILQPGAVIKIP